MNSPDPRAATEAFVLLGYLAVERGVDASGFAAVNSLTPDTCQVNECSVADNRSRDLSADKVRIVKDTVAFTDLWNDTAHRNTVDSAQIVIGHTRWASQGRVSDLANASPMIAGSLIGTHNGDCDARRFSVTAQRTRVGGTDTEALYLDLAATDSLGGQQTVLEAIRGRAALAWLDLRDLNVVTLVRAGLSPLATAYDQDGNFYWASNPGWFREIDAASGNTFGFHQIKMMPEGTITAVRPGTVVDMQVIGRFTPTVREIDTVLSQIIWRGFDPQEKADDQAARSSLVA